MPVIIMPISTGKPRVINRIASVPLPDAVRFALPNTVDPADYNELVGGGYSTVEPVVVEASVTPQDLGLLYTPEDQFVKYDSESFLNGFSFSKSSAGDGVTPFGNIPPEPNPQVGSVTIQYETDYPGDWVHVVRIQYESGRVETYRHEYTVIGPATATYDDKELYVNGMGVPEYKEDWQTIADFWDGRDNNKRDAAQLKADESDPKPTGLSHPYQFAMNTLESPPADIQQAIDIAAQGASAASDGIGLYEALAETNPAQAQANELAHYLAIVNTWAALEASTTNPNLKAVAKANTQATLFFITLTEQAYNGDISFEDPDRQWKYYEQYMSWFAKQPADSVVSMGSWEFDLGRPS